MSENIPSIFDSAEIVRLRPGDVVVFRCQDRLNDSQRAAAKEVLDETFGEFDTLILDGGQDIAVVRPEPGLFARMFRRALRGA